MDAVDYLKTKARMNKKCAVPCEKCLLNADDTVNCGCDTFEYEQPEVAVERMEQWAKEHPIKTRQGELLKLFPKAKIQYDTGSLRMCPQSVDTEFDCENEGRCADCKKKYWLAEINEV